MIEPEDRYDRLILWIVTHMPARGVLAVAAVSYLGFGLALPLMAGFGPILIFDFNMFGVLFAASLLFGWLFVQVAAANRRNLVNWTSDLRMLDAHEFELLIGEVLRREGWEVTERGRQDRPDGNIDLEIRRAAERRIVQAKRWESKPIGVEKIRAFGGTLLREGLAGKDGMFVTLSEFTSAARADAKTSGIELVDGQDLYARVEKVRQPVICDECKTGRMVLDRSAYGWWYRCVTPGCKGKQDLSPDAARALALINEPR